MITFKYNYDETGDVLYTYINKPEIATTEADDGAGLLLRTSIETNQPCGVTVLDFKGNYGFLGADALCFNIQHFLQIIPLKEIEDIIHPLLSYKRG